MLHSNIEEILDEMVRGNEELQKLSRHFLGIEHDIDSMANRKEDLDDILKRAKELIYRVFDGHHGFLDGKWRAIEKEIKHNLRELEKK